MTDKWGCATIEISCSIFIGAKSIFDFNTWVIFANSHKYTPAPEYSLLQSFILNENDGSEKQNTTRKKNDDTIEGNGKNMSCMLFTQQIYLFLYFNVCCALLPMEFPKKTLFECRCMCLFMCMRVSFLFRFHSLPLFHGFFFSFFYFMSTFMTLMECRTGIGMQIFFIFEKKNAL